MATKVTFNQTEWIDGKKPLGSRLAAILAYFETHAKNEIEKRIERERHRKNEAEKRERSRNFNAKKMMK